MLRFSFRRGAAGGAPCPQHHKNLGSGFSFGEHNRFSQAGSSMADPHEKPTQTHEVRSDALKSFSNALTMRPEKSPICASVNVDSLL